MIRVLVFSYNECYRWSPVRLVQFCSTTSVVLYFYVQWSPVSTRVLVHVFCSLFYVVIMMIAGGPLSVAPPGHKFHLVFDGNPGNGAVAEHAESPSHVSTPRKVIREIIV